jgi:hypothetical protein
LVPRKLLFLGEFASDLVEVLLGCAAQRANPICRQVLKISTFLDTVIGITRLRAVFITAQLASIYAHFRSSFRMMMIFPAEPPAENGGGVCESP